MPITEQAETMTFIGPQERQVDGSVKTMIGPRELPAHLWKNKESRAALIAIGVRPLDEALEPSPSPKHRASTTQKQIDEQAAEIAALKEQLAAVLAMNAAKQEAKEPVKEEKPFKLNTKANADQ